MPAGVESALVALRNFAALPSGCNQLDLSQEESVQAQQAGYARDGQPFDRGCYDLLRLLDDNAQDYLSDQLSQRPDRPMRIILLNDGTAVMMIGIGFATMRPDLHS